MQITTLSFDFSLHPGDIRAFRAAIVEVVGLGHHLFHGHDNSEQGVTKYSNAYPHVRFAVRKGKAQIIGMGKGADAIRRYLIPLLPSSLVIAGRPCSLDNWKLDNRQWEPELLFEYRTFGLRNWMALNTENYEEWKNHEGNDSARRFILDRCLTGHLRALAEHTNNDIDRNNIVARTLYIDRVKKIQWKNNDFVTFDVVAEANFVAPYGLGLGRSHSFGFGEVCSEQTYEHLIGKSKNATIIERKQASQLIGFVR